MSDSKATPNGLSLLKKVPRQYLLCFLSALLWGLLAHGMTLFNKYSLHEDPSQLYGVGATYISGRWMLDILYRLEDFFLGGSYSLPLVNGLTSIFYLALSACLILWLLSIRRASVAIALGGIMVVTPTITGTFGYMFTAPHYTLGTLMTILGVCLICKCRKWYGFAGGAVLIACSIGIYQAVIPVALCALILYFIQSVYRDDAPAFKKYALEILYLSAACLCFLAVYFLANKLYLHRMQAELLSYQGIDSMGTLPLGTYFHRILVAYKQFLIPSKDSSAFMYPNGMVYLYWLLLVATAGLSLLLVIRSGKQKAPFLILPMAVLPLASNFIFVMCDPGNVHSLMVYSHVLLFVYALWLSDTLVNHLRIAKAVVCTLVIVLCALYVRFDNICYLKAELVQQQTISYCTTLVTQIKSTEGYTDGMPVAYVQMQSKEDSSVKQNEELDVVNIIPYKDTDAMINSFAIRSFIETWCGFAPDMNYSTFADDPRFQQMPCYPDAGSIQIIDGVVVVKCS